jgi:hypothetical protein
MRGDNRFSIPESTLEPGFLFHLGFLRKAQCARASLCQSFESFYSITG